MPTKAPVKKAPVKKAPVKKAPTKKAPAKEALEVAEETKVVAEVPTKKAPAKKAPAKKEAPKSDAPVKKAPAKKTAPKKEEVGEVKESGEGEVEKDVFVTTNVHLVITDEMAIEVKLDGKLNAIQAYEVIKQNPNKYFPEDKFVPNLDVVKVVLVTESEK